MGKTVWRQLYDDILFFFLFLLQCWNGTILRVLLKKIYVLHSIWTVLVFVRLFFLILLILILFLHLDVAYQMINIFSTLSRERKNYNEWERKFTEKSRSVHHLPTWKPYSFIYLFFIIFFFHFKFSWIGVIYSVLVYYLLFLDFQRYKNCIEKKRLQIKTQFLFSCIEVSMKIMKSKSLSKRS